MLLVDPKQRYRARDVLSHDFVKNRHALSTQTLAHQESSLIKENMGRVFKAVNVPPPINLDPVNQSKLAIRRAEKRLKCILNV